MSSSARNTVADENVYFCAVNVTTLINELFSFSTFVINGVVDDDTLLLRH